MPNGARLTAAANVPVDETYFSANQRGALQGRLVLLLVDQGNINIGAAMPIVQEAAELTNVTRTQAARSLDAMRALFLRLAAVDGPKHVILVSQGLMLDIAADARASIDVLLLDVQPNDVTRAGRPTTPGEDRRRQEEGLDTLAGFARGTVYRVTATAAAAFDRIGRALAGYYVLGLETRPSDRGGKRRRISVSSACKGPMLRTRRSILPTAAATATTPTEAVRRGIVAVRPARRRCA